MEYMEFSAKTVSDAITEACQKFTVTSERLEYVVVSEGSSGFLGLGAKPAIIKARVKEEIAEKKAVKADEKVVAKVEATAPTITVLLPLLLVLHTFHNHRHHANLHALLSFAYFHTQPHLLYDMLYEQNLLLP